jgi:hypothetical protein
LGNKWNPERLLLPMFRSNILNKPWQTLMVKNNLQTNLRKIFPLFLLCPDRHQHGLGIQIGP